MANQETISLAQEVFEEQERRNGHTNSTAIAQHLIPDLLLPAFSQAERAVVRMPTREFLYEGAQETIQHILSSGDHITIWTQGDEQGQLWKVASSGLGKLRRTLPRQERKRFSVFSAQDKIDVLPSLVVQAVERGNDRIIVVDDKAQNIVNAARQIEMMKALHTLPDNFNVQLVWINQGRTRNQVPEGFTLESFKDIFSTIEDIRELQTISTEGSTQWLIDFDHTLVDTARAKENLFITLADIKESAPPVVSHDIDHRLGLKGNILLVYELKGGMSSGKVLHLKTDESDMVVKYNPVYPDKIQREIDGYRSLQGSPLAAFVLPPYFASKEDGVIVLPYFQGMQLRDGVRTGYIPYDLAYTVLTTLLDAKLQWWSQQEKQHPNNTVSMQRDEWKDTVGKINQTFTALSETYGIPLEDLWNNPLVIQEKEYPSFLSTMTRVAQTLETYPPYTVFTHGDATGANILVNAENKEWKIIDAEWTGLADPAEAFVRMTKYISTTTVQDIGAMHAHSEDGKLYLSIDVTFPKSAIALQNHGLSRRKAFGKALQDSEFVHRSNGYLAGSYAREVALAAKRGHPEMAFFAMLKASEAITL